MDDWMRDEILAGFQQLVCLGLERQPARDLMPGTVMAWVAALNRNRVWDQALDTARLREGFLTMMAERVTWPSPKEFVESLPGRPEMVALPPKVSDPEKAKAIIDAFAKEMRL